MTNNSLQTKAWAAALTATLVFAASFVIVKVFEKQTRYECDPAPVAVAKGDTLWSIVKQRCTGDIRSAVEDAVKLNDTQLDIGDVVKLSPRG
jgi:hypothetical protein